jgi:uncharacterized membrane protein
MGMQCYAGSSLARFEEDESDFLPSPDMLAQYEAIMPGSAERMLRLAEDRANHRYEMEQAQLAADTRKAYVALGVGGGLAGVGLFIGAVIAFEESVFGGMVVIAISFILFASIFSSVVGQRRSQPARAAKRLEAPRQAAAFDL